MVINSIFINIVNNSSFYKSRTKLEKFKKWFLFSLYMEYNIAIQWYMSPVWAINAINFGRIAYNKFKKRERDEETLSYVFWSIASISSIIVLTASLYNGLEKLIE